MTTPQDVEALQSQIKQLENQIKAITASSNTNKGQGQGNQTQYVPPAVSIPLPKALNLKEGDVTENFNYFKRAWENYVLASGLNNRTEEEKVAILLTAIGEDTFKRYPNFEITNDEKQQASTLLTAIGRNLRPETNIRYERALFNMAQQDVEETYDCYFDRLQTLVKNCQYGSLEKDLMLDKIIYSIKDITLREQLWLDKTITLDKAIDRCKSKELSDKQLKNLKDQKIDTTAEVNKFSKSKIVPKASTYKMHATKTSDYKQDKHMQMQDHKTCKYCGYKHESKRCPAKGAICKICKKLDHFAKVCKSRRNRKQVQLLEDTSTEEEEILSINKSNKSQVLAEITFCAEEGNRQPITCQVDTGASCNIIDLNTLCRIQANNNPEFEETTTMLRCFGGSYIKTLGRIQLECEFKDKREPLMFELVQHSQKPLLSAETCSKLGIIKICNKVSNVSHPETATAKQILREYEDVFEGIGLLEGKITLEVDPLVKPIIQQPRRVPVTVRRELKAKLEEMESQGIIVKEENHTDWVSNIVIVKRNGKLRICLDPLNLNKALKSTNYQLPTIEEILPELSNAKVFTTLDAKCGFWQLKLEENSSKLTTFWTPFGRYRFLRLPFGISPAMEIYQMKQHQVINGLKGTIAMADDILVFGEGNTTEAAIADHNQNLQRLLERLRNKNLKLNKEKVKLCKKEVKFYGHILTNQGLKPDNDKIVAITNLPEPKSKADIQRFLGMITYLSKFIPHLSQATELLRKKSLQTEPFNWTSEDRKLFQDLKNIITTTPVLQYYDAKAPLKIQTDASSHAMGSVLLQNGLPVIYASKTLSDTQKRYCQLEKEALAILFACKRFDQYICGRNEILIETDHKPLLSILEKPLINAPKRIQSMILRLQRYNIKLVYKRGQEMYIADILSRNPAADSALEDFEVYLAESETFRTIDKISPINNLKMKDITIEKIKQAMKEDESMMKLYDIINKGWPEHGKDLEDSIKPYFTYRDELTTQEGLIIKGNRVVVPVNIRAEILERLHYSHQGIESTTKLARETVFWPGITNHIKDIIQKCDICMKYSANKPNPQMLSHEVPTTPFQRISMDVCEITLGEDKHHLLITVDHYSDFFEIDKLKGLSATEIIKACKKNFSRYGIPVTCITDNATNFTNEKFKQFSREWDFQHTTSSPHHQQGNGKAEAAVKIVKQLVKKSYESQTDFYKALLDWRNTPNKIGSSPAQRLFSRRLRSTIPSTKMSLKPRVEEHVEDKIIQQRHYFAQYYNKKATNQALPQVGADVWYKKSPKEKQWEKGQIVKETHPRSYEIETTDNSKYRRSLVHIKNKSEEPVITEPEEQVPSCHEKGKEETTSGGSQEKGRATRNRQPPVKFKDYVLE